MTPHERSRRTAILCCHCLRNIAFYRAGYRNGNFVSSRQFFITANGNFLDIAILEWCKLFAETRGKHHYSRALSDADGFRIDLLAVLGVSSGEYDDYLKTMRTYRDKFVAHLDEDQVMMIPRLTVAKNSAKFLYTTLLIQESGNDRFHDAPSSPEALYRRFFAEGRRTYRS